MASRSISTRTAGFSHLTHSPLSDTLSTLSDTLSDTLLSDSYRLPATRVLHAHERRNDLIWAKAHDYGIDWWEQGQPGPGGATTWTEHLVNDSWSQPHCLAWADIDGDGQSDLITGKRVRAHGGRDPGGADPECLSYYTWNKVERQFTRHTIGAPGEGIGGGTQIRVADLNADGCLDIVVAGKTGTWLVTNEGFGSR